MLELGNQVIRPDKQIPEITGKAYFHRLGYEHTSVDLNGLDGALVKDLSKLEDFTEFNEGQVENNIDLEDTGSVLENYIESIHTDVDKKVIKDFMKSLYLEALNKDVV